jgi:hypothetical protein
LPEFVERIQRRVAFWFLQCLQMRLKNRVVKVKPDPLVRLAHQLKVTSLAFRIGRTKLPD